MANKPVPFNAPQSLVQSLLGMVPAGASVTVSVPVAADRNLHVSVGIAANAAPQPQPEPPAQGPYRQIDMGQDLQQPARYWYQQPEAE